MQSSHTPSKTRPFEFGVTRAVLNQVGSNTYVQAVQELAPYAQRMTDRLIRWAKTKPMETLVAQRDPTQGGAWKHVSYAQALAQARHIGQALLDRKLSVDRPLIILSENSLEHALLSLGAMYVGVPFCPVSPPYSLVSTDFEKLRHIVSTLTPGLVFVQDAGRYGRAIEATVATDVEVVAARMTGYSGERQFSSLEDLLTTPVTPEVDASMKATGPDTVVKFLFTSGSTKLPKAVINTQRMVCSNQQQMRQAMPTVTQVPLVMVDWMPWHHTAGGNHNFYMALDNGGTLYIDEGKPTPALLPETIRNLREVAPTWYFNVPIGYEAIANAMETDSVLRGSFLSKLTGMHYAGAAIAQPILDKLNRIAEQERGERIVMTAGLGMTESSPFALFVTNPDSKAGHLGLPAPGIEVKLVPMGDKVEVRYRGPNITPGYWRNSEATAESYDDEGFFCSGDAVQWIDENDKHLGLRFDGRIAEDFKLATGTFVSVGPLRSKIIAAGAPYVQDVVLTGLNMNEVGAMIFPTSQLRDLSGLGNDASAEAVVASPSVNKWLQTLVNTLEQSSTGSANRIAKAIVLIEPPSIDNGEVTDKGSINQRSVLKQRDALVQALHRDAMEHIVKPAQWIRETGRTSQGER